MYLNSAREISLQVKNIQEVISLKRKKLQHALLLRLNNEIDPDVYKEVKAQYEEDICQLSLKEAELMNKVNRHRDYLEECLASIDDISNFYKNSSVKSRQAVLALVLSDKLIYDNNKFQSGLFNSSVKLVCKINKNG